MTTNSVAVDVGYGFTKAVGPNNKKICIPSLIAPASSDPLGGVFGTGEGHKVRIRRASGGVEENLVGEAAAASYSATSLDGRDKPAGPHDLLVFAAAHLAGAGYTGAKSEQVNLAVGLPLAYYTKQRDALRARLGSLSAWVSVDGKEERCISFGKVLVYPQGAGVVIALRDELPATGYVGVIDVGHNTTEYLLLTVNGALRHIPEASGSVEMGINLVSRALSREFQLRSGAPLPQRIARRILGDVIQNKPVTYSGREIDLTDALEAAKEETTRVIHRHVLSAWGDLANFVSVTYLAGGGSILLSNHLRRAFPTAQTIENPVFGNVIGYLAALSGKV